MICFEIIEPGGQWRLIPVTEHWNIDKDQNMPTLTPFPAILRQLKTPTPHHPGGATNQVGCVCHPRLKRWPRVANTLGPRAYVYRYLTTSRCPSTVTRTVSSSPSLVTLIPKGGKNVGCYSESVAQPLMGVRTKSGHCMHPPLYHIHENCSFLCRMLNWHGVAHHHPLKTVSHMLHFMIKCYR